MSEIKKAAHHPDTPRPSNDELIVLAIDVVSAIEVCGASPELTNAVVLASDLLVYLQKKETCYMKPLSFGEAIEALKKGLKVSRSGWNGKGMWLILVPGTKNAVLKEGSPYHNALKKDWLEDSEIACEILPHIDMWTTNSEGRRAMLPGWLASQTDMLSNDWQIVE